MICQRPRLSAAGCVFSGPLRADPMRPEEAAAFPVVGEVLFYVSMALLARLSCDSDGAVGKGALSPGSGSPHLGDTTAFRRQVCRGSPLRRTLPGRPACWDTVRCKNTALRSGSNSNSSSSSNAKEQRGQVPGETVISKSGFSYQLKIEVNNIH